MPALTFNRLCGSVTALLLAVCAGIATGAHGDTQTLIVPAHVTLASQTDAITTADVITTADTIKTADAITTADAVTVDAVTAAAGDAAELLVSTRTRCHCSRCQQPDFHQDRLWAISTRGITSKARCAQLESPKLTVYRLSHRGRLTRSSMAEYFASIDPTRSTVIYVHGNRMDPNDAINRGMVVYRRTRGCCKRGPYDWVIWSWPSEKDGILLTDARRKFRRIDAQSLYLAWLLREHHYRQVPTAMVGYSFGGRVVSGALHALAGGRLGGRVLPGQPVEGAQFDVGLVAPAIERFAMSERGAHSKATRNIDRLLLLYNHRDAVLKRFRLLQQVRGSVALGYAGPSSFAPRFDGSRLPVVARDCAPTVGLHHVELDYYAPPCNAGREMAAMINDVFEQH